MQKSACPYWSRGLKLGIIFLVCWAIVILCELSNHYLIPTPLSVFHEDMLPTDLSQNNAVVFEKSVETTTTEDQNITLEQESVTQVNSTSAVKGLLNILNSTQVN
uniref:TNFAIP3-interacting protein 3 n=1 Tax=Zeugodacus cucurbitae TaxID=28588 RepID=A0A0A1WYY0_ZEUCU